MWCNSLIRRKSLWWEEFPCCSIWKEQQEDDAGCAEGWSRWSQRELAHACVSLFSAMTWRCQDTSCKPFWGLLTQWSSTFTSSSCAPFLLHVRSFCRSKRGRKEQLCQQRVFHPWGHSCARGLWGGKSCQESLYRDYILGRNGACVVPYAKGRQLGFPWSWGSPACLLHAMHSWFSTCLSAPQAAAPSLRRLLTGRAQGPFFHPPPPKGQEHVRLVFLNTSLKSWFESPRN